MNYTKEGLKVPLALSTKETMAVHAGERDSVRQNRSVTMPIEQTATYFFKDTSQIHDFYAGKVEGVKYGRYGCPTQHAVESKIAALESADRALLFASGMSALTTTVLSLVKKGDHILFLGECYRNTRKFFTEILPDFSIESTEVPMEHMHRLESYLKPETVMFFAEIPTNPFLRVIDIGSVIRITARRNIVTLVDATFASPINLQPIAEGVDLVVHSATKYLGGHHDLSAGVLSGKAKYVARVQKGRDIYGGIIDPHSAFLLLRGMETLFIRMEAYNRNGMAIARFLENNSGVKNVWYPGLPSHPDYTNCTKYLRGPGGVITFELHADERATGTFIDTLRIPYIASSFGGPQSMIEQHAVLTFFEHRDEAERRKINGSVVRYSVGFENVEDVLCDFENAFIQLNK